VKRGPFGVWLLVVLALLSSLAVVVTACGGSAPDEFVGTWHQLDFKTRWTAPLVIARANSGYHATLVYANSDALPQFDLNRAGDGLKGEMWTSRGNVEVKIVYQPQSGHLLFRSPAMPGGPVTQVELTRVSTRTTIPTPSPL
jgi:hypothetical protein